MDKTVSLVAKVDTNKIVYDYWRSEGLQWDWNTFQNLLPSEALTQIASYVVHSDGYQNDVLKWGGISNGK